MSSSSPLHVFRGILRHLKTPRNVASKADAGANNKNNNVVVVTISKPVAQVYVQEKYRASSSKSQQQQQQQQQLAMEYLQLQKDLKERARLHKMDAGAEDQLSPKELSRRAAARAGWQLPKLDPDLK